MGLFLSTTSIFFLGIALCKYTLKISHVYFPIVIAELIGHDPVAVCGKILFFHYSLYKQIPVQMYPGDMKGATAFQGGSWHVMDFTTHLYCTFTFVYQAVLSFFLLWGTFKKNRPCSLVNLFGKKPTIDALMMLTAPPMSLVVFSVRVFTGFMPYSMCYSNRHYEK